MLTGAHGWRHESLTLFTHLRNEIFHKARMDKAGVNRGQSGNSRPGSNRSTAGDVAHGAGAGRGSAVLSAAKSSSNPGLPGNTPAPRPAEKKASFGGMEKKKSLLQVGISGAERIQFGSFLPISALADNLDPPPVSSVKSVAVGKKEIHQVDRIDDQTRQRPQKSGAEEVDSAPLKNVWGKASAPLPLTNDQSVAVRNKDIKEVESVDKQTGQLRQKSGAEEVDSAPLQNAWEDNSALLSVSNVQPVAVGNKEIKQVDTVYEQTGPPPQKSGAEEVSLAPSKKAWGENSAHQPKRGSPSPNWTAKDVEQNKTSDPSPNFSFASSMDFPALGGPPSGVKARQGPAWRAEAPVRRQPENELASKPGVDMRARAEVSQKWYAGREAVTSSAEVSGHERDEQIFKRGRGGGGNHWRDGGGEWRDPIDSLGRTLTRILRHQALDLKIKLRSDGYVDVQELLKLPMKTGSGRPLSSHTVQDVLQAVELDNKQRFGIKEENGVLLIRANQGHTIKAVETGQLLKPVLTAEEIPVCVHGTYRKSWGAIAKAGLKRMSRNHVHFASGLSPTEGVISGMRKTTEILIYLDVSKALEDGMKLYISENGVILTEGFDGVVPPMYFKQVMSWPDNKPMNIK